jgi:hypothetical protein
MKIRLILLEGKVEDIVEKYPKLQNLYNQGLLNNIKPAYVEWIAKQNEPPEDVIDLIPAFEKNIQRLSVKDINRYTSEELTLALEQLSVKKAPEQIKSEDSTILGQFGPWLVVMPHTTESSCHWGSGTTWCTARTTSQNLFLSYVARRNKNIILYYIINNQTNDDNSKISIGFVNGKPLLDDKSGGVTVNKANKGLNEQDLKNILGEHYEKIINTLQQHSDSIKGKHPAKKEMEALAKNLNKLKKYLSKFKNKRALQYFINEIFEYSPTEEVFLFLLKRDKNVSNSIALNAILSSEALAHIANNTNNPDVLYGVSMNIRTPLNTLLYIANIAPNRDSFEYSTVLRNIVGEAYSEQLTYIANNTNNPAVLSKIAQNENTPPETLTYIANNTNNPAVLSKIAQNENTPPETLTYIANNTNDPDVLSKIVQNENTPPDVLIHLVNNTDDLIYYIFFNPNPPNKILKYAITHIEDEALTYMCNKDDISSRNLEYIAKNTQNIDALRNIAKNNNTLPKTLRWIIINIKDNIAVNLAEQNLQNRKLQRESKIKLKINLLKLI